MGTEVALTNAVERENRGTPQQCRHCSSCKHAVWSTEHDAGCSPRLPFCSEQNQVILSPPLFKNEFSPRLSERKISRSVYRSFFSPLPASSTPQRVNSHQGLDMNWRRKQREKLPIHRRAAKLRDGEEARHTATVRSA